MPAQTLTTLQTPALILDQARLRHNTQRMSAAARNRNVTLRPHVKTAKSVEVARLATQDQPGGITVSTLREAEYFASHGSDDILYAVCIVPDKLERVARLQQTGVRITLITDSPTAARAIADTAQTLNTRFPVQIELDSGEGRTGVFADGDELLEIARILDAAPGTTLTGVLTHAGHSYRSRTVEAIEAVAETERATVVTAAQRIRELGIACGTVSVGSTPTALHARSLEGVTELRAGVYVFGDMFQAQIHSCGMGDLALSVLAEVISHHRKRNHVVVDAGSLALSQDRSTANAPTDIGFGRVTDVNGREFPTPLTVARVHQEHGQIPLAGEVTFDDLPIGSRVRIYPNHACITAAMYDRYRVVDSENSDGETVVADWARVNGW